MSEEQNGSLTSSLIRISEGRAGRGGEAMLEFISRRRMLLLVAVFVICTALVIFMETWYTDSEDSEKKDYMGPKKAATPSPIPSPPVTFNSSAYECYKTEGFVVKSECVPCSKFEVKSGQKPYCAASGYYDQLECESKKQGFRPCYRVAWLEERKFNIFVLLSAALAALSTFAANWRGKILDRRAFAKIQQQLGEDSI